MDLKVAEEGRVPGDDGGEQVEGGDALMSSYHMLPYQVICYTSASMFYICQQFLLNMSNKTVMIGISFHSHQCKKYWL